MKYQALSYFIPELEGLKEAGHYIVGGCSYDLKYDNKVVAFMHAFKDNGFQDPTYLRTLEEESIADISETLNFHAMSERAVIAMLSFLLSNGNVMSGVLKKSIENGTVVKCLRRLQELDGAQ